MQNFSSQTQYLKFTVPFQPPYSMGTEGALSPGVNWQGHEVNHSPPISVKIRTEWSYTYMPEGI